MALGKLANEKKQDRESRIWLSIQNGQVECSENGTRNYYSYVEGSVERIYTGERTYNGETVTRWFIDIRDEEGNLYSMSLPYGSGTFKSIVLALASDENLSTRSVVRIEPYLKGHYTNVKVWSDGVKLDWIINELPPLETVEVGGKTYKDDSKRMQLIESYVKQINSRLKQHRAA